MDQKVFSDTNFHVGEDLYSSQGNNCCGCSASLAAADTPLLGGELVGPPDPGADSAFDLTTPGDLSIAPPIIEEAAIVDTVPPTLEASPTVEYWTDEVMWPTFTWPAAMDQGAGINGYHVYWGPDENGTGNIQVTEPAYSALVPETVNDAADYYLRVAPVDNVGNVGEWRTMNIWRYDAIPPDGTIEVSGGEVVLTLPVTLNLVAADEHSSVTAMRFSTDGQAWTEWEPYAPQRNWQLDDTSAAQTIYAQFQDVAGNISTAASTTVTADLSLAPPSSANYRIARSVMGMGGGSKASSTYRLQGTSGQPYETGLMQSGSYRVASGYWAQTITSPNQPPNAPATPSPANNATAITVTTALSWSATDPDNDPLTYEVRFGTSSNPPQVVASQSAATYDPPGNLAYSTTYYWQIIANDGKGGVTIGPVWSFTTAAAPPQTQTITLTSIADAYTSSANPTTNYGNDITLRAKEAAATFNTYVQFDTSALSCAQVQSATLRLYTTSESLLPNAVYAVGSGWTETGINWSNAPVISGSALDASASSPVNTWVEYDVTAGVTSLGGPVSFAVKGNGTDVVYYSSRQGVQPPQLVVEYTVTGDSAPTAAFSASPLSGNAPLPVAFTNASTGCPTSYRWDLGDGTISSAANPNHTYANPGTYTVSLTATNGQGSDVETKTAYITVDQPLGSPDYFISPSGSATIGGIPSTPADILRYEKSANRWTMVYDGSVRGTVKNVAAFDLMDDGSVLLVFGVNQPLTIGGAAVTATPYDVVKFTPSNPNSFPLGAGTFTWFFQGKPAGLTTTGEKIDALELVGDRLLLSTVGAAKVLLLPTGTLTAADEDVFAYNRVTGRWDSALVIDGSKMIGMAVEDISGVWDDPQSTDYYVTIVGAFNLGGVKGNGKSIVKLTPNGGATVFTPSLVPWLAPGATFPTNLDGLDIQP